MKTKYKKVSDSRAEITVTLDAEDLKKAEKKALEKLSKEIPLLPESKRGTWNRFKFYSSLT